MMRVLAHAALYKSCVHAHMQLNVPAASLRACSTMNPRARLLHTEPACTIARLYMYADTPCPLSFCVPRHRHSVKVKGIPAINWSGKVRLG